METWERCVAEEPLVEAGLAAGTEEGRGEETRGREEGTNVNGADAKVPDKLTGTAANGRVAVAETDETVDGIAGGRMIEDSEQRPPGEGTERRRVGVGIEGRIVEVLVGSLSSVKDELRVRVGQRLSRNAVACAS